MLLNPLRWFIMLLVFKEQRKLSTFNLKIVTYRRWVSQKVKPHFFARTSTPLSAQKDHSNNKESRVMSICTDSGNHTKYDFKTSSRHEREREREQDRDRDRDRDTQIHIKYRNRKCKKIQDCSWAETKQWNLGTCEEIHIQCK